MDSSQFGLLVRSVARFYYALAFFALRKVLGFDMKEEVKSREGMYVNGWSCYFVFISTVTSATTVVVISPHSSGSSKDIFYSIHTHIYIYI